MHWQCIKNEKKSSAQIQIHIIPKSIQLAPSKTSEKNYPEPFQVILSIG